MPRQAGVTRKRKPIARKIAKQRKIPVRKVSSKVISARLKTRVPRIQEGRKTAPGAKVWARPEEDLKQLHRRLKKSAWD